jgi:hypothetical protein
MSVVPDNAEAEHEKLHGRFIQILQFVAHAAHQEQCVWTAKAVLTPQVESWHVVSSLRVL